jgi:Nuclease-related domain
MFTFSFLFSFVNFQHSMLILIAICLLMLVGHIISNNADAKKILDANAVRRSEVDLLRAANHKILNSGKGKKGEDEVHHAALSIFQSLNIECISNRQLSCPHAILLPTGNDKYSKEIDLVIASEIGIFVIEVKDWRGLWAAKDNQPHLLSRVNSKRSSSHVSSQQPSNDRPAPLLKTQHKLKDLLNRASLTNIHAEALVVFTDSEGNVDIQLPPNYLHINELTYYFRQKAAAFFNTTEIEGEVETQVGFDAYDLAEQIRLCLDTSPNAMHDHMMRLSPTSESLQTYQSNHRRLVELEAQPILMHQSDRPFGYWASNMLFFMSLAAVTQALS